jgi:hypothetical protein
MRNRLTGLGLAAAFALTPGAALAQEGGITIDHKEIECIVAGKFPKMNACFNPGPNVARARVYFRPEGVPSWYYVEMKSDTPCLAGVLPRPRKELVGTKVDYYVQVTDKSFAEARTAEYHPLVVNGEGECKDKPVAAYLSKASVQVFPGMPAGFAAGGIGTAAVVGIGAGVAGIAGGAVAIANNGSDSPTVTTAPPGTTTPPVATMPPATTLPPSSTTAPATFNFVFKVSPTMGTGSVDVTLDMCDTTPKSNQVRFFIDFGNDGFESVGNKCMDTRTITTNGLQAAGQQLPPATTTPKPTKVTVKGCAEPKDGSAPQECGQKVITVNPQNVLGAVQTRALHVKHRAGRGAQTATRRLAWNSELAVEGATGQVVANGSAAVFAGKGRSSAVAVGRKGENRIEAQLVQGAGKAGTWRFELGPTASFEAGSLRVLAGEVAQVSGDTVVFRLKGTPGERVVFTFRTAR